MKTNDVKLKLKPCDFQLADIIRLGMSTYEIATVKQIEDGIITLFRPYVHTGEFEHTGGVTCYVGIEEFVIYASSEFEYEVLERKTLK